MDPEDEDPYGTMSNDGTMTPLLTNQLSIQSRQSVNSIFSTATDMFNKSGDGFMLNKHRSYNTVPDTPSTQITTTTNTGGGSNESVVAFKFDSEMKEKLMEVENEYKEQLSHQRLGYEIRLKAANDENVKMRQQLSEKDIMIKTQSKKVYEINEIMKEQKKRMVGEFEHDKDDLMKTIDGYKNEKNKLIKGYEEKLEEMEGKCNGYIKESENKTKQIKRLKKKNKELEMIVNAPPENNSCYAKWFNYGS